MPDSVQRPKDADETRKRAVAFLRDILKKSNGKSSEDIAVSILNLALEDGNPVREFFIHSKCTSMLALPDSCYFLVAASASGTVGLRFLLARTSAASPERSVKSRSSSKILRIARREYSKISPSKTPTPNQQVS